MASTITRYAPDPSDFHALGVLRRAAARTPGEARIGTLVIETLEDGTSSIWLEVPPADPTTEASPSPDP